MLRTALQVAVRVALVVGVAASFGTGCSRQAEGERCDFTWAGDQDCDDGLVCTPCGKLQDSSTSRCCKPGGAYSDTRCIPTTSPSDEVCNTHLAGTTGGTTGDGTAGKAGTAGTGTAGTGTSGAGGTSGTTGEAGNGAMSGIGGASGAADGG